MPTKKTNSTKVKKTTSAKTTSAKPEVMMTDNPNMLNSIGAKPSVGPKYILLGLIVAVLLYYGKGLLLASVVNGEPISRLKVIESLEKQGGAQILNVLQTEALIRQEAKKRGITVTSKDVDAQIKKIDESLTAQGQNLKQALEQQGMTMDELKKQSKIQILLEKMLNDKVVVTDKEVEKEFEAQKAVLDEKANIDDVKKQIKLSLRSKKMDTEISELIAQLKKDAKIYTFVKYGN